MIRAINLGSGQRPFHSIPDVIEWTNVDSNPRWNPDLCCDAAHLPVDDSSQGLIVAHHIMEHVGLGEFDPVLRECHRVLIPGGSLIITTPDLRALTHAWIEHRIDDYIFCVNLYGAFMNDPADRHLWSYTKETLARAVISAWPSGSARPFDWRTIPGASIAQDWWIQGIEAIK